MEIGKDDPVVNTPWRSKVASIPRPVSPPSMKRTSDLSLDSSWSLEDDDRALFRPPPMKRIRRRSSKSVRFDPQESVHFRHASREDLANAWYKPRDWETFREECRKTVVAIAKAKGDLSCLKHSSYCILGLENYIAVCLFGRPRRQRKIVREIILMQQWQKKRGLNDEAGLKNAYLRLSRKHKSHAIQRAATTDSTVASKIGH